MKVLFSVESSLHIVSIYYKYNCGCFTAKINDDNLTYYVTNINFLEIEEIDFPIKVERIGPEDVVIIDKRVPINKYREKICEDHVLSELEKITREYLRDTIEEHLR